MADRGTIMAGVWDSLVEQWNAGNIEAARSLERFYAALEELDSDERLAEDVRR